MAQQLGIPGSRSSHERFADAFVIFSVTVLSMALGAWFLLQLGLSLWPGMAAALSVYTVLLLFHLLVRRSLIDAGGEEPREEMQWIAGEPDLAAPASDRRERSSLAAPFTAHGEPSERLSSDLDDAHALPDPSTEIAFHYRPRDAGGTLGGTRVAPRSPPNPVPPRGAGEPWQGASSPSPSEKNVELIQDLIKKLADELSDVPATAPTTTAPAGDLEEAMIARSLAALDTAAASMRAATGEPANEAAGGWWPAAEAPSGLGPETPPARPPRSSTAGAAPPVPNAQVSRAAEAIAANRMETLLEPIQALNEGRARHFEISARFLAADGAAIDGSALERTGLIARMDAAAVIRAARVAHRLGERGREGNVLTRIAAESLTDPGFIDAVLQQAKNARGMGLILTLSQAAAHTLTDIQISGLNALTTAGCHFALEEVGDLKMDFASLKAAGFAFVKLEAPVFLEGLAAAGGRVAASDVVRFLGDYGLTLIVARIEDDWMLARILGFGVQFGMGGLFGGPKLVKAEVVGEPAAA
ncbi:MAG TPA: EAL domain-containing protein [Hyphomicrobiaceae bacterium]|nr:EAL domain-containing protein [Hyphomicrobiaceae bacterium]